MEQRLIIYLVPLYFTVKAITHSGLFSLVIFYSSTIIWFLKIIVFISPPGFLCPRASLHSSQPLQKGVRWWQQDDGTSVCAPAQHYSSWLGIQCDSSLCLASSQLPQAACISRGPVLCGRLPVSWFHLWTRSLSLHQQQGGSAQVGQPRVQTAC